MNSTQAQADYFLGKSDTAAAQKQFLRGQPDVPREVLLAEQKEREADRLAAIRAEEEERQRRVREDAVIDYRKHNVNCLAPEQLPENYSPIVGNYAPAGTAPAPTGAKAMAVSALGAAQKLGQISKEKMGQLVQTVSDKAPEWRDVAVDKMAQATAAAKGTFTDVKDWVAEKAENAHIMEKLSGFATGTVAAVKDTVDSVMHKKDTSAEQVVGARMEK